MISKKDKEAIIEALNTIDVKEFTIPTISESDNKWFRFGSYNGLKLAKEIIKKLPERKKELTKTKS